MHRRVSIVILLALAFALPAHAYIEVPYTLGKVIDESTVIVLMEIERVNVEKNLIIYKKVEVLKGEYPDEQLKHNIGDRGFHPREWQTIQKWAKVGERAVFFANADASETCTGDYWYQCYREDAWWGMVHAEPYMLRTFTGKVDDLVPAVKTILQGKEAVVTCFVDGNRDRLHQKRGRVQRLKASLERIEYDAKRDFVAFGGDGEAVEYKTETLIAAGSAGWRFAPAARIENDRETWTGPNFVDARWSVAKTPVGYGEEELTNRGGTLLQAVNHGEPMVFRRTFDVPARLLTKDAVFRLSIASDNRATVHLNATEIDAEPEEEDHEFAYWNRDLELTADQLKTGKNVLAIEVFNLPESSDLYFDLELTVETPVKSKPKGVTK